MPHDRSPRGLMAIVPMLLGSFLVPWILSSAAHAEESYPKQAPFTGVRWKDDQPEVLVNDEWSALVSLDGVPVEEILAFCQKTYRDLWQKRFAEDLVEVLSKMGHPPQSSVQLVVRSLATSEVRTLEAVPMTEANRRSIRSLDRIAAVSQTPISLLVPILRQQMNLVGLAAMVSVDGNMMASAVDGERKIDSGAALTINDRWHIGSATKSVTATMIARLVEAGTMAWTDTIGEAFPESTVHPDWKPVTLHQLLTHTSGAPANFPPLIQTLNPPAGPKRTRARRDAALMVLAAKPENPPGERFEYSNIGYTIAGVMAEKATNSTWENLVKKEVFGPLKLTHAGFGPPKSPNAKLPQPRGHVDQGGRKLAASDQDDNTPVIGPAGTVHMTLQNLSAYGTEHLQGHRGTGTLLSAETFQFLHEPVLDQYACGWVVFDSAPGIPHKVYWHNGSNTMWYALVAFIPDLNMVVAVTSNDGDIAKAEAAAWAIVTASVQQFGSAAPDQIK